MQSREIEVVLKNLFLAVEFRNFTTIEDLRQNGLYADRGLYYGAGTFQGSSGPATIYASSGLCTYSYDTRENIITGCKYIVDDGNYGLDITVYNGEYRKAAVIYGQFAFGRVVDENSILHVGKIQLNDYIYYADYAGEKRTRVYSQLIYKPYL